LQKNCSGSLWLPGYLSYNSAIVGFFMNHKGTEDTEERKVRNWVYEKNYFESIVPLINPVSGRGKPD